MSYTSFPLVLAALLLALLPLPALAADSAPLAPPAPATRPAGVPAPKPLFRDPVYDGAADPTIIWNRGEKKWFMLYTNRRANAPGLKGVAWVHGTRIGIAESADGAGAKWTYRGVADIAYGQPEDAHWAPEVIWHEGLYHMYLSHVPGMHEDWGGTRDIAHLTSKDLLKWKLESTLKLASDHVIDACVARLADGTWRMWYKNEADRQSIYWADSTDLYHWKEGGKAVGDQMGEGPNVFRWKDRWWMVTDVWEGQAVYRSEDAVHWTRQPENLLRTPGKGNEDQVIGSHADVVVSGDRAYLFYFTHPGRRGPDRDKDTSEQRRSSIQVVELRYSPEGGGMLTCDRDQATLMDLKPPVDQK